MFISVHVCEYRHTGAGTQRSQKKVFDPFKLELQVVVSHPHGTGNLTFIL